MRVRVPVLVLKKVAFAKTKTDWGPMQINLGATTCNDFYADGLLGQYVYVYPSKNIIIVRLGKKEGKMEWPTLFKAIAEAN